MNDYDPHEYLAEDLLVMIMHGRGQIARQHLYNRGKGLVVADLVEEMLVLAERDYWLPSEFYDDWRAVKCVEQFDTSLMKWSETFENFAVQ